MKDTFISVMDSVYDANKEANMNSMNYGFDDTFRSSVEYVFNEIKELQKDGRLYINKLIDLLPDFLIEKELLASILYNLEDRKLIAIFGDFIYLLPLSIEKFVSSLSKGKDKNVFIEVLSGTPENEICASYNVSKKEIEDCCKNIIAEKEEAGINLYEEKVYLSYFMNYDINVDYFNYIFDVDEYVYNYLKLVEKITGKRSNKENFIHLLNEKSLSKKERNRLLDLVKENAEMEEQLFSLFEGNKIINNLDFLQLSLLDVDVTNEDLDYLGVIKHMNNVA